MRHIGEQMMKNMFYIYGDNIVECNRALNYIFNGLAESIVDISGPEESVTCPKYTVTIGDRKLVFQLLPGFGDKRWSQNIMTHIQKMGGMLGESVDAIVILKSEDQERPIVAIEFSAALSAGNQAWQRQGRAYSFAKAGIPYFHIIELGGIELDRNRMPTNERMPNPIVPFSFMSATESSGTVCLPVYEPSPSILDETRNKYSSVFGGAEFESFLRAKILDLDTQFLTNSISRKCAKLISILAESRKRKDSLTADMWHKAIEEIQNGKNLPDFLEENIRIRWKKTTSVKSKTDTAVQFMSLGSSDSFGITSSSVPLSFVPRDRRLLFSRKTNLIYPRLDNNFIDWIADESKHLAIAWVSGFKPKGEDARPDRGLSPLARMLVGSDCDLMTFVYGPVPRAHWEEMSSNPVKLAQKNGLWGSIMYVSDSVLIDSNTMPKNAQGYICKSHISSLNADDVDSPLRTEARVLKYNENDVSTVIKLFFDSFGDDVIYEGLCNPPGGDWSGIEFSSGNLEPKYRWPSLPRVSRSGTIRPDHVYVIYGHGRSPVCLCIESKERAKLLKPNIGRDIVEYVKDILCSSPSSYRKNSNDSWSSCMSKWECPDIKFLSAGAYIGSPRDLSLESSQPLDLDLQVGIEILEDGRKCNVNLIGITKHGQALVEYLSNLPSRSELIRVNNKSQD